MLAFQLSVSSVLVSAGLVIVAALFSRIFYNLYLHPLSKFPGPWYTSSFSISLALISLAKIEPQWLQGLVKRYGTNTPIRVSPTMLLFPKPSALKDIYWDPKCNEKPTTYGSGALGPPHLFTTLDSQTHKALRKALAVGAPWSIGQLKNEWEPRFDDQLITYTRNLQEKARKNETVCLSDKVAEFAADIMTMINFTEPWGFVKNNRDERGILKSWRQGLDFVGFVSRWRFFRMHIMTIPVLSLWLLPKSHASSGMGYLMAQADREVTQREEELANGIYPEKPDFMQYCIDARIDDEPLTAMQKRAHVTLLIMAGADTTATAIGSTLRFLVTHPSTLSKSREEIERADRAGLLSSPILYEEARVHLPYTIACIKEGLRLHPPATNLFARLAPKEGKHIDGFFIPPGTEISSNAYIVQRDPELYAPDPEAFRPERWLVSAAKAAEMEAGSFVFGMGPRVCLGKDIAIMELYKIVPETVRRFDMELVEPGAYVVAGGVAYNKGFMVKLSSRE